MISSNYSKHKDRDPLETVEAIKETLASIGLETEFFWTSNQYDATWSNRIIVPGTSIGTNGKGTTPEYAMASGYAEFMERIQNKIISSRTNVTETFKSLGFYDHPDERLVSASEVVSRHDPVVETWLEGLGCGTDEEKEALVEEFGRSFYRRDDDMIAEVPFVDVGAGEVRWLSPAFYNNIYGSNGMCAGNTLEECLVQGLSEIFERHVILKVLDGEVTPPEIPREVLGSWSVGTIIERIEEGGRYQVHVFDGSMGRGYPVAITAIVDLSRGSFGVDCGAHPSLAIAVERTLTEAFQGRDAELFSSLNRVSSAQESSKRGNWHSILKNNRGVYPMSLFAGEPSWEFKPWQSDEGLSNAELLRHMVSLLERDGRTPLVRDASHLGFCTCHVIVPGMSETMRLDSDGLEFIRTRRSMADALNRFPCASDEEQRTILHIEDFALPADVLRLGHPLRGGKMQPQRLFGYLHLARKEYEGAERSFRELARGVEMPATLYWQALADYAQWRSLGSAHDEALGLVRSLYPPAFARRVENDLSAEGEQLLAAQFPRMRCHDCESCEMGGKGYCTGAADGRAFAKIDAALARSRVSQVELLARLRELLGKS